MGELLRTCGRQAADRAGLVSALRRLHEDLRTSLENASAREQVGSNLTRMSRELDALDREMHLAQEEWDELLRLGGAADEENFRTRGAQFDRRTDLLRQIEQHETALELIAGPGKGSAVQSELAATNHISISIELEQKRDELGRLIAEQAQQLVQRGRLSQSIEDIERSEELSEALLEERSLRARLEKSASDWAVKAVCKALLERTRQRYEREKQPHVIQVASEVLASMTSGAYPRVFSPLGQEEVELETSEGARRDVAKLSRGTREQLYLAIRFGLIREYGGEPLPVIMDDILVNFDPARSRAAAQAILELAASNQVMFFTCHPQTADMFSGLDGTVRRFRVRKGKIVTA